MLGLVPKQFQEQLQDLVQKSAAAQGMQKKVEAELKEVCLHLISHSHTTFIVQSITIASRWIWSENETLA